MYIPSYYKSEDLEKIHAHLHANPFGIITNSHNGRVEATHIPFVINRKDDKLIFLSHLSKANPQWQMMSDKEVLVIFQGPDAYISPSNYEKRESVPTWNYTTVHVRGVVTLVEDDQLSREIIEKTIDRFEPGYMDQWKSLSETYKSGMMKGLVSFEIRDPQIEAKFKLSQNKTAKEIGNIVNDLDQRSDLRSKDLSNVMKKHYKI